MRILSLFDKYLVISFIALISIGIYVDKADWRTSSMIRGDAHGYCAYLASWVIYQDFTFEFYNDLEPALKERYWLNQHENLKPFPKLTMGVAMLQLPSFLIAHWLAGMLGYAQDGWSVPYHFAIGFNGVLAFLLGLWFIQRLLLKRFSKVVTHSTLLLVAFATNALYYGVFDGAQSHIYSFMLVSIAMYGFDKWVCLGALKWLLAASLSFGFIVLIRPTNVILIVLPIIYIINNKYLLSRILSLNYVALLVAVILPMIPQFVIWKMMTGQWLFYSYGTEKIYWLHPHIWEGLFSYRNGWLTYTPVMIFALTGIWLLRKMDKNMMIALAIIIPLHVYIVFSWWCWYYGSSLSIRPMIDFYPLLAFGLAAFIRWLLTKHFAIYPVIIGISVLLVINNSLQIQQYSQSQLSGSDMTGDAFWTLFFNTDPPKNLKMLGMYSAPDTERLLQGKDERTLRDTIIENEWLSGKESTINKARQFGSEIRVPASEFDTPYDRIMHVMAIVKSTQVENYMAHLVISFDTDEANYGYHTIELHKVIQEKNEWMTVHAYLRKPQDLPEHGVLKAYGWYQKGDGKIEIKDLKVQQLDCPYVEPL